MQHVDGLRGHRALIALVHVGQHRQAERLANFGEDRQRGLEADAARAAPEVRLALSNDVLNTRPIARRAAISFNAPAISSAWARLSSWHGPAMRASGSFAPKRAASGPRPTGRWRCCARKYPVRGFCRRGP